MRFAYADPPYPGLARTYYADHPDFAGEVDHDDLLSRLQAFDGWALSTSARSLRDVCSLAVAQGLDVRIAAWFRGARRTKSRWPLSAWEPVVFAGGRRLPSSVAAVDVLHYVSRPRRADPFRVVGAKPAAFCWWLFDLLGARPGDELVDLFPGSGGVSRAWSIYSSSTPGPDDSSRGDRRHTSSGPAGDESRRDPGDTSLDVELDTSRRAAA